MDDDLFARAEKVRRDAIALGQQLDALRELLNLERDFRRVTRKLAVTMKAVETPNTREGLRRLLYEAEELVAPPPY